MVSITNDLRATMSVGVLRFDKVTVVDTTCRRIERFVSPDVATAKDLTGRIGMVLAMYRQCGIDPTKTRPSSEALLRRLRRGDPLPRINTLVDICNACSVQTLLPYGLYDLDRIIGAIELRLGQPGEAYSGIRKGMVHVEGRPALFDTDGPFGNPTSDSARTMVTSKTCCVLLVVCAPRLLDQSELNVVLDLTAGRVLNTVGGEECGRWVI
jgi:DNA/RNA-binding domain of Phe-tRNA-synthetase-like protein